jgi:dolichol kinase
MAVEAKLVLAVCAASFLGSLAAAAARRGGSAFPLSSRDSARLVKNAPLFFAAGIFSFAWATAVSEGAFDGSACHIALAIGFLLAAATGSRRATTPAVLFALALFTTLGRGFGSASVPVVVSALFLLGLEISDAAAAGFYRFLRGRDLRLWRIAARPFALIFILIDLFWTRRALLIVLGLISLGSITLDLVRIAARLELRRLFKAGEKRRFSSITGFLAAVFIMFLVFPDSIPYLGLTCLTMGDLFSKFAGIKFGKRRVIGLRTWEGSTAYFCGSLLFGYALYILIGLPLPAVVLASFCAAVTELCSGGLDDNFTVGIVTGAFLTALRHFSVL